MRKLSAAIVTLLLALPAQADGPPFFLMQDADSKVYILGSVHALKPQDLPLPETIESAYRNAERLVLEVDPRELDPIKTTLLTQELGIVQNGTLADTLSKEAYARARASLQRQGLDIQMFRQFEPWVVALQVLSLNLMKHGFDSASGVDSYFGKRALEDGKPTEGLETVRYQLSLFDSLSPELQEEFLLETLEDSSDFRNQIEELVNAWREGDMRHLESVLDKEFGDEPELKEALLDARNRHWIPEIEQLLEEPGISLVIVGALHLAGEGSVIDLLEERGHDVRKVDQ